MIRLLSGLVLIIGIAYSSLPGAKPSATILVVGDSLSAAYGIDQEQGWVFLLQQYLQQNNSDYRVVNASISGDTTLNALNRMQPALERHQPNIVILELGGNDGLRGLSLTEMKHNLSRMIVMSQQYNARVLLTGIQIPPNYGVRYSEAFHNIYHELASHHGIPLVPSLLKSVGDNSGLMQADGLHPNGKAQAIILQNVLPFLEPMLAKKQTVDIKQQNN
ncbi:MAG TPA: arylesterase [Gammaproteobacteria bacterium]